MAIRGLDSKALRLYILGATLGFRTGDGFMTNIPAIIVFVGRKVHSQWLLDIQILPNTLQMGGSVPAGVWCNVDGVEFVYYGPPAPSPKEQLYSELVEALRGCDSTIGSGSQVPESYLLIPWQRVYLLSVARQETYRTLGCIVRSLTPEHELGFLSNRHVTVDLDHPHQKIFHPLPPSLGPGLYLYNPGSKLHSSQPVVRSFCEPE
ncbi:hypothetical protein Mapa_007456 [Marchantia paleacea]|nr:hypothetical protein Mapa_007456 [Marchantia paleacea]